LCLDLGLLILGLFVWIAKIVKDVENKRKIGKDMTKKNCHCDKNWL